MKFIFSILLMIFYFGVVSAQHPLLTSDLHVIDQSELKPGENIDEKIANNLFLKAEVNKTSCYVGENIMAEVKAYGRLNADSRVVQRPSLSGFSVIEMVDAYNSLSDKEKYKGVAYHTHLIRKVQLFPLQSGEFTVEPAEIETTVWLKKNETDFTNKSSSGSLFPKDITTSMIQKDIYLSTPPIKILVKPLPIGQPEDFSGAVGQFTIRMELPENQVAQFQPLVAKLIITGTGNLTLITDPDIDWPSQNDVPEARVSEDLDIYRFPLKGKKIFEYKLATKEPGAYSIPSVRFTYFDPEKEKYQSVNTEELHYRVSPAVEKEDDTSISAIASHRSAIPLQYVYFGIIVVGIAGVIIYQFRKKKE